MKGIIVFCGTLVVLAALAGGSEERAEMQKVKIAMCQIFCLDGDREGNFARIENALVEAKQGGAKIACFPETAILGWVNPDAHKRACAIPGADSDRLCALAKEHDMWLCVGLAEKDGEKLYDSAILVDSSGIISLKHRKMNILENLMTPPYTRGTEVKAVETEFGRIGLLICADTFAPEILEKMSGLKPDLLLVPYGWAAKEDQWPGHGKELAKVVKQTAEKTGAAVVGTDLVGEITHGPWRGRTYGGQSVAADKSGTIIAVAKDRDREIAIVTLDAAH
jgi:predicted amidohydrolase